MRPVHLAVPLFFLLAACSSNDGGGKGSTAPSQTPNSLEPSGPSAPLEMINVSVQGKGSVVSRDAKVNCVSDGANTTGDCSAYYETTLYAEPVLGWSFSHWEPNVSDTSALLLTISTPHDVKAVFTQD
jgi:hypothetical protein